MLFKREEILKDGPGARLRESLVILAARLVRDLHLGQVDSLVHHQLYGVIHRFCRQEARAPEDPGVVHVEQAENVGARVDNSNAGVVGGQNPVWAVGGNWGKEAQTGSSGFYPSVVVFFFFIVSNTFVIINSKV